MWLKTQNILEEIENEKALITELRETIPAMRREVLEQEVYLLLNTQ